MNHLPNSLAAYRWFSQDLRGTLSPNLGSLPDGLTDDPSIRAVLARLQASGFSLRSVGPQETPTFDAIALHPDRDHETVTLEMVVSVSLFDQADWDRVTNGLSQHEPHVVSVAMDEIRRLEWPGPMLLLAVARGVCDGHYYAELFPPALLQEPTMT